MNAIEIIALIGVIILCIAWCYYRVRLIKSRKEGASLQTQLKEEVIKIIKCGKSNYIFLLD